jgi:hypothetical protein
VTFGDYSCRRVWGDDDGYYDDGDYRGCEGTKKGGSHLNPENQPTETGANSLLRQGGNHSSAAQRETKSAFFQFLKNHQLGESHQTENVILAVALTVFTVFIYLIVMGIAYLASPKAPDPQPKDPREGLQYVQPDHDTMHGQPAWRKDDPKTSPFSFL